jgi:hypothetical protein
MTNYRDFRVTVTVKFAFDVGATSEESATIHATRITETVFRRNFGRAEDVEIDVLGARPLTARADHE